MQYPCAINKKEMTQESSEKIRATNTPNAAQKEQLLKLRHEYLWQNNPPTTETWHIMSTSKMEKLWIWIKIDYDKTLKKYKHKITYFLQEECLIWLKNQASKQTSLPKYKGETKNESLQNRYCCYHPLQMTSLQNNIPRDLDSLWQVVTEKP